MPDKTHDITFSCTNCGQTLSIDQANPPNDDDIISCIGCGRDFGPYAQVKQALIEAAKEEVNNLILKATGAKPTWTKQ